MASSTEVVVGQREKIVLLREYVARMRERAMEVRRRVEARAGGIDETYVELEVAQEELTVADEEIRRQNAELHAVQARLQAEVERLRGLFDDAHEGLAETDVNGVVRLANRRLATMLAIHPTFLERRTLIQFVARRDCRAFRRVLLALGERGEHPPFVLELRPRQAGGRTFLAELRAEMRPRQRTILWSVRPFSAAAVDDDSSPSLGALLHIVAASVRDVAGGRVAIVESPSHALHLTRAAAKRALPLLEDLARTAVRLAPEDEPVPVEVRDEEGAVFVSFGRVSARLDLGGVEPSASRLREDEPGGNGAQGDGAR